MASLMRDEKDAHINWAKVLTIGLIPIILIFVGFFLVVKNIGTDSYNDIVGFITKGRGISVHRKDCSNITSLPEEEKARFIDVEWEDLKVGKEYDAEIILNGIDRRGLFSDISRACEDMDVDLTGVNAKATRDGDATMTLTVKISSTQQMQKVLRTLRNIEGVTSVYRARS